VSYKRPRRPHGVSVMPFFDGARYVVCWCGHVKRNDLVWPAMRPLIHKGGRPRR
jgi:hypothetical protein